MKYLLYLAGCFALFGVSCKKGTIGLQPSYMTFTINGQSVSVENIHADTTGSLAGPYRPDINILGYALLPGMQDSSGVTFTLFGAPGTYAINMLGTFSDTSTTTTAHMSIVAFATGDPNASGDDAIKRTIADITSNNGVTLTATFQAGLIVTSGAFPGGDSLVVTNGRFSINF